MLDFINTILGIPLGFILRTFYVLTGHFGISVLVFAVIVRLIILPTNYFAHKNSIRFLQLQPALYRIKRQFSVDREFMNAARYELFKEKKYRPILGFIPLLLQLFLLIGVLQVMYHPLQHVSGMSPQEIRGFTQGFQGFGAQITAAAHHNLIDMNFLGIDLGAVPSFSRPALLIMPLLSGLSAFVFCIFQTKYSPGALTQSNRANALLTAFTVAFSVYFAWILPAGVGIYWIVGNVSGIGVVLMMDKLFNPKELAPEAYEHIISIRKTKEELACERALKKQFNARSKADAAKFKAAKKELVFYALTGGQYKYYAKIIEHILENSDITIHYLTNDPGDKIFEMSHPGLEAYYASEQKTVGIFLNMDCDILITTVQDLQTYHIKRSVARLDIEYIHIPHGPASLHLTAREAAYDHFDTIFCVGQHQANELRRREELADIPKRTLVKAGYGLYDQLIEQYKENPENSKPQILIAPSWQPENILDICIDPLIRGLAGRGWKIIVRPHPQHIQVFPEIAAGLAEKFADEIIVDTDFLSNERIYSSDLLITDWSGIAFEFSFTTLKPCIFINTPMKVLNPDYEEFGLPVMDIVWRNKVGVSVDLNDVSGVGEVAEKLLAEKDAYKGQIAAVAKESIFHHGRSGEAGGKYIIRQLRGQGQC